MYKVVGIKDMFNSINEVTDSLIKAEHLYDTFIANGGVVCVITQITDAAIVRKYIAAIDG